MALAYYALQNTKIGANYYAPGQLVATADLNGRGPLLVKQGKVAADGQGPDDDSAYALVDHTHVDDDSSYAVKANTMAVVNHGTDGSMARPTGVGAVYWIGSATPANAVNYDMWWSA